MEILSKYVISYTADEIEYYKRNSNAPIKPYRIKMKALIKDLSSGEMKREDLIPFLTRYMTNEEIDQYLVKEVLPYLDFDQTSTCEGEMIFLEEVQVYLDDFLGPDAL